MSRNPEIQWLIERWKLPLKGPAIEQVERLLQAEAEGSTAVALPAADIDWGEAAAKDPRAPLVLCDGHLQSLRCYKAETIVARRLADLVDPMKENPLAPVAEDTSDAVAGLFPDAGQDSAQVQAARTALAKRLTVITGGPGTGKTYTLARILALLIADEENIRPELIRLAAPTGKAADRMKQSVMDTSNQLVGVSWGQGPALQRIGAQSSTLHSLLGYNPSTGKCRHNAQSPLPCQVLIVDECSMVDLHLWKALMDALPTDARLILVGDPLQLQSVGQGNVFGDLVNHARDEGSPFYGSLVRLTESWRFQDQPGICELAEALERSDSNAAEELLRGANEKPERGLIWLETGGKKLSYDKYPEAIRAAVEAVARAGSPLEALAALDRVCILTAHRGAFVGADAVGTAVNKEIAIRKIGPGRDRLPNQPVIIKVNDPETGLRNGAVGLLHTDTTGKRRVWFKSRHSAEAQDYPVGALPEHGSAWAITIHRSQGSEYDDVLVILPREESPLTTRELLYTAITRAKKRVYIAGTIEAVRKAVETPAKRTTLLASALDRAAGVA
ncbi:MAG: exodeoxyribonuclease V subunit alpha [Chthoniobacterales bacterium]|nr:exodeoxyribonuclease V subunit alpha [Chthoniobacterales bacterium]